ncbi:uncharacterized protein zgc:194930 [Esox lucius]|nr:uncharacterized protein zgc:194930 [Esox lucius]XP_010886285.1 uncharacterized protein zgc:194930 [Esox lucius]XP_010886286.1 uncharacterized protein zgc:194930 [Esox lucius]XP_019898821.1 uncharacterized protein zgc:194930 [Esox lucius]
MGCQCCRMLKSYIYDPTAPVDVHGRKRDPSEGSLYRPHSPPADGGGCINVRQKQGFHNLGFSNSSNKSGGGGGVKLEIDNNYINSRHGPPAKPEVELGRGQGATPRAGEEGGGGGGRYILHPERQAPRRDPSEVHVSVPVYPDTASLGLNLSPSRVTHSHPDKTGLVPNGSGPLVCDISSADELDEGVGGTPEYLCDTGDEESVLSVDIQTSTTSLSSVDTKGNPAAESGMGISVPKSEDEGQGGEEDEEEGVLDSMVAEALAALEAATAGEDCED